jgi:hypothetical protein
MRSIKFDQLGRKAPIAPPAMAPAALAAGTRVEQDPARAKPPADASGPSPKKRPPSDSEATASPGSPKP